MSNSSMEGERSFLEMITSLQGEGISTAFQRIMMPSEEDTPVARVYKNSLIETSNIVRSGGSEDERFTALRQLQTERDRRIREAIASVTEGR